MPKIDVIQRLFRRTVEENDGTRLIQAYTAETDFYNHKFSYEGICYRNININSEDQFNLFKKGTEILNQTFISTTRTRPIAEEYILDH
ncbi:unnamed protein product [Rotaria magnacalcarata]|nr:unnamed protein product [Rotaria magnacalcarata]CAF2087154.1 unnamed protein product [Rotaria magnacalcarata]